MDLSTGHMAYTVHTQDARRAEQQREFRRVAEERAVELAASEGGSMTAAPVSAKSPRRFPVFPLFGGHRATAQ
jgi:hypothetical protein